MAGTFCGTSYYMAVRLGVAGLSGYAADEPVYSRKEYEGRDTTLRQM